MYVRKFKCFLFAQVIEIPYGTDLDNDDEDLDAMLSSFRNVPVD